MSDDVLIVLVGFGLGFALAVVVFFVGLGLAAVADRLFVNRPSGGVR